MTMYLNADMPYFPAWCRKEFLYNGERGHGEYVRCYVFGVTAMEGRCLAFTLLLDTGAQWARMPIHGIVFDRSAPLVPLTLVQPWDCPSYHLNVIAYRYLRQAPVGVLLQDGSTLRGHYLATVDYAVDPLAENDEHKCTHLIKTENGLLLGQPNNRCLWGDATFTNPGTARPDYKSHDQTGRFSAEADFAYLERPRQVLHPERSRQDSRQQRRSDE